MAADDSAKKQVKLDRLVKNLGTRGGRAALCRRLEHALRMRNTSVTKFAIFLCSVGTLLFFIGLVLSFSSLFSSSAAAHYGADVTKQGLQAMERILANRHAAVGGNDEIARGNVGGVAKNKAKRWNAAAPAAPRMGGEEQEPPPAAQAHAAMLAAHDVGRESDRNFPPMGIGGPGIGQRGVGEVEPENAQLMAEEKEAEGLQMANEDEVVGEDQAAYNVPMAAAIDLAEQNEGDVADHVEAMKAVPDERGYVFGKPAVFPGVDADHLHGKIGRYPDGAPTWKPDPLTFRMTFEQKVESNRGYCFNTRQSEALALDRSVPDYNGKQCLAVKYDLEDLPAATVIIVFHNENLSVLLRSVHSVLNRTPPEILDQIVLVDDKSNQDTHPWLADELENHIAYLPKTRIRRLPERSGLMLARMAGVAWSRSPVVAFLDSHIECSKRWLEPLCQTIKDEPKTMPIPLIHTIDADHFDFETGYLSILGFSWSLGQTHPHRPFSNSEPMDSPVMAGGLFAAGREWFEEIGGYDDEMRLYGGEEMEIGFKVWMCGGRLVAHPCSRVGHVFRTSQFWVGQVYKVPGEEIHRNKLRVAEVWMDDYKRIAQLAIPPLPDSMELGPFDKVKAVRERLNCKSFQWYLDNIYPELRVPDLENSFAGSIENEETNGCLDTLGVKNGRMGAYPCHHSHGTQSFLLDQDKMLRAALTDFVNCINLQKGEIFLTPHCDQPVDYDVEQGLLRIGGMCLEVSLKRMKDSPLDLIAAPCDASNKKQKFRWAD